MKINFVEQFYVELNQIEFDLILCASGYERRGSYLISTFELNSQHKICLGFKKNKDLSREFNDAQFTKKGFEIKEIDDNVPDEIMKLMEHSISLIQDKKSPKLLVDISSMSTLIYSTLFKFFRILNQFDEVDIFFTYTQAKYSKPNNTVSKKLKHHNPIPIYKNLELTGNEIALIVGLGYEKDKALGLCEYFQNDRDNMYIFMTSANDYSADIMKSNEEVLSNINENNIIKYDIGNIGYLINSLNSLVEFLLNQKYRIVIAPTGPKIFTLAALIIGTYHDNKISIYRSSVGDNEEIIDKIADDSKEIVVTKVNYILDND